MAPFKLLVVGGGSIGERHVRCFLQTGRVEVSLCEINDDLRRRIGEKHQLAHTHRDLSEAIDSPPDAAVVCTPAHLHVAMAAQLVECGCHVLVEKPLGTSLDGIHDLVAAARRRELTAAVAYVYRAHPALAAMRQAIHEGRFGRPLQLTAVCGQNFPHYRPAYRDTYYRDRATGGGAVQDALTHVVDAGQWLIGPIDRLAADVAHQQLADVEVEDTVGVIARHGDVPAVYSLNQFQAPNEMTITVACERGTARFEMHRQRWRWLTAPDQPWQDETVGPLERDTLFIRQAEAFLDAALGKRDVLCSLQEGLQALRVNRAILRAAERAAWQRVVQDE